MTGPFLVPPHFHDESLDLWTSNIYLRKVRGIVLNISPRGPVITASIHPPNRGWGRNQLVNTLPIEGSHLEFFDK